MMKSKPLCCAIFLCAWSVTLGSVSFAQENSWPQWGQNPQHTVTIGVAGQPLGQILQDIVYDPLVPDEQAATGGELLAHYQVPILSGQDVFMEFKTGTFDGTTFNTEVWHEKRLHWQDGQLVEKWDFTTNWKPEPISFVGGWEPVFHAVLANGQIYVPNAGGTISKLNRGNGTEVARINPFGTIDPNTFVAGPLSADSQGNLYYNVLKLTATRPFRTVNSWLVQVRPDDSFSMVAYTVLLAPANPPTTCFGVFGGATGDADLPWPPSVDAVPPTGPCGPQRPGVNVAPAIAPDGTIYTVSRADRNTRYGYVVAVNPDLTPKWAASLRDRVADGCGVLVPIATVPLPPSPPYDLATFKGKCRNGANVGVDPLTNQKPAGRVLDQSSSSPTVLPDGSVLYGAHARYNVSRGILFKFSSTGQFLGAFDFGWDSTPAVFSHDGTYSIVIKDNHYDEEEGFYCNTSGTPVSQGGDRTFVPNVVCDFTGVPGGPFYITQLKANLVPEWQAHSTETQSCTRQPDGTLSCVSDHPHGFEWCINAPVIDANNNVYVESEDGNAYLIPQGQSGIFDLVSSANPSGAGTRLFMQLALGAAYTPLSIDQEGRIYTQNAGHLFVLAQ